MLNKLIEIGLSRIIGLMVHKRETLTAKARVVQDRFMGKLNIQKRKTDKAFIVAMIGLVGSGKTSVARELADFIGATVIEGDSIRTELRKCDEHFEQARIIAEDLAIEVVNRGGNVILDSDFIDIKKRASLQEKARKIGVNVVFICVYADIDVMIGRMITADYSDQNNDFFVGASSKWYGPDQSKGAVVKIREMWRRTPLHYQWRNKGGGSWKIKNPPCDVIADIDTTDPIDWKYEVAQCAQWFLNQ